MANIQLSFAINPYEHVRDLLDGTVRAEGIDFTFLCLPTEEIFHRFVHYREWDLSEMAFGKLVAMIAQGDESGDTRVPLARIPPLLDLRQALIGKSMGKKVL